MELAAACPGLKTQCEHMLDQLSQVETFVEGVADAVARFRLRSQKDPRTRRTLVGKIAQAEATMASATATIEAVDTDSAKEAAATEFARAVAIAQRTHVLYTPQLATLVARFSLAVGSRQTAIKVEVGQLSATSGESETAKAAREQAAATLGQESVALAAAVAAVNGHIARLDRIRAHLSACFEAAKSRAAVTSTLCTTVRQSETLAYDRDRARATVTTRDVRDSVSRYRDSDEERALALADAAPVAAPRVLPTTPPEAGTVPPGILTCPWCGHYFTSLRDMDRHIKDKQADDHDAKHIKGGEPPVATPNPFRSALQHCKYYFLFGRDGKSGEVHSVVRRLADTAVNQRHAAVLVSVSEDVRPVCRRWDGAEFIEADYKASDPRTYRPADLMLLCRRGHASGSKTRIGLRRARGGGGVCRRGSVAVQEQPC